jgi:hypothetical protein
MSSFYTSCRFAQRSQDRVELAGGPFSMNARPEVYAHAVIGFAGFDPDQLTLSNEVTVAKYNEGRPNVEPPSPRGGSGA